MKNPLSELPRAEADLVLALNATADRLDQVGTSTLDAALERLQASAEGATARLAGATVRVRAVVLDVLGSIEGLTADLVGALGTPPEKDPPALPMPTIGEPAPEDSRGEPRPARLLASTSSTPTSDPGPALAPSRPGRRKGSSGAGGRPGVRVVACPPTLAASAGRAGPGEQRSSCPASNGSNGTLTEGGSDHV